jgi:hypothetical protein
MIRSTLLAAVFALGALTFDATAQQPAAPQAPAAAPAAPAATQPAAAAFRRFNTKDGKSFYAAVLTKNDLSVTFRLQSGQQTLLAIRDLSAPDQMFVRKWTKFKDELMNNAQFAKLTIKEMLELRGYQSFEFDIQGNHIFVEGEVNGKQTRFLVDTGAHSSIFHIEAAKDAGVEIGPDGSGHRGHRRQGPGGGLQGQHHQTRRRHH